MYGLSKLFSQTRAAWVAQRRYGRAHASTRRKLAMDALFVMNRNVRSVRGDMQEWVYDLKSKVIRFWYEQGDCSRIRIHRHTKECWGCDGTGWYESWYGRGNECYRCAGTGIYSETLLVEFTFDYGRPYVWHQPERLTWWLAETSVTNEEEFVPRLKKHEFVSDHELDIAAYTLMRYCRDHDIATVPYPLQQNLFHARRIVYSNTRIPF